MGHSLVTMGIFGRGAKPQPCRPPLHVIRAAIPGVRVRLLLELRSIDDRSELQCSTITTGD